MSLLAKLTSKNQLTLPKAITQAVGPASYFEVQAIAGQIVLTPVRIQRGDVVRAQLVALGLAENEAENAVSWVRGEEPSKRAVRKPSTPKKASSKPASLEAPIKKTTGARTGTGKPVARKAANKS